MARLQRKDTYPLPSNLEMHPAPDTAVILSCCTDPAMIDVTLSSTTKPQPHLRNAAWLPTARYISPQTRLSVPEEQERPDNGLSSASHSFQLISMIRVGAKRVLKVTV